MVKAAVIGTGYLGSFHAEKYAVLPQAELVAVCDKDSAKVRVTAKKHKTLGLTDYRKLPDLGVNCVSVASDTCTHYEITKYLLEAGVDVLVEKPMTTNIGEAEDLIETAAKYRRILQVGHLERFNPVLARLKEQLRNPWYFEVRRIAPFSGRGADVDVILDLMIHDIDLLLYLADRPIIKIEAMGIPVLTGTIDIANARLTFEGGAVANVSTSRAAFQAERTIRVFQPDRYISLDLQKKRIKVATRGEGKTLLGFPQIDQQEEFINERDALKDQISAFIESVERRTAPLVTGEDGLRALSLVERIKESMRETALRFETSPPAEVASALGVRQS